MIKLLRNSADVFIVQWKLVFIVLFHEQGESYLFL